MAVQVSTPDIPKLAIAALTGLGALFVGIVILNHVHFKAGAGGSV
jgi:hypothetical protein